MERFIRIEKHVGMHADIPIPDNLSDEEIIKRVSSIVGAPIDNIAFEVFEPTGDIRLFYKQQWQYTTTVSERAIKAMLSE